MEACLILSPSASLAQSRYLILPQNIFPGFRRDKPGGSPGRAGPSSIFRLHPRTPPTFIPIRLVAEMTIDLVVDGVVDKTHLAVDQQEMPAAFMLAAEAPVVGVVFAAFQIQQLGIELRRCRGARKVDAERATEALRGFGPSVLPAGR